MLPSQLCYFLIILEISHRKKSLCEHLEPHSLCLKGLKSMLLLIFCALWLTRYWAEASAPTTRSRDERSAGWARLHHPTKRPHDREGTRPGRGGSGGSSCAQPGQAESPSGTTVCCWALSRQLSPASEAVDLAFHKQAVKPERLRFSSWPCCLLTVGP